MSAVEALRAESFDRVSWRCMERQMRRLVVIGWLVGIWLVPAGTVHAASHQVVKEDSQVILTLELLEKLAKTQNALDRSDGGRGVGHVDARLENDIANAAKRLELDPEVRAILDRVGWSAIEYLSVGAEFLKTLLVMQGNGSTDLVSAPSRAANVRVINSTAPETTPEFSAWKLKYIDPLLAKGREASKEP